jgi:wyosine [tRNA(Phe)-imidazoG37] synthetase (radical SAM superfamily)
MAEDCEEGRVSSVIYGPVPSWRLGRSLGVDLLPGDVKTCSFDCVYCQLGRTTRRQTQRADFVPLDRVRQELERVRGVAADYVTFAGMGEPTLASNLGEAIRLARAMLDLPVAVLTNSSLMAREDVREEIAWADLVVAKLDAPNERLFRRINRPAADCRLQDVVRAIRLFRAEYAGKLALEMMFVRANRASAAEMAAMARELSPDEVQINTPLRPCAVAPLTAKEIAAIRGQFKGLPIRTAYEGTTPEVIPLDVGETLRRRPAAAPHDRVPSRARKG